MPSQPIRFLNSLAFKKPLFSIFRVTNRCNFTCKMCGVWKQGNKNTELSLVEIEKLGRILKKLNISIIALGGGEPFLREDLPEIVKILSKDFTVRMQTNAVLATESKVKALAKAGLKGVSISLDTLSPQKEDYICNSKGVWYKIIEKMLLFSRILPKRGSLLLSNAVVSRLNIGELPRLTAFVNKLGYSAVFLPVLLSESQKHNYAFRDYAADFAFRGEDYALIESVYQELIDMKKKGYQISNSFPFLRESAVFLKKNFHWKCDAAGLYFHVGPDGSFLPCTELRKTGSLFDDRFVDKFYSKDFRKLINNMIKGCPSCMQPCQVEVSKIMHNPGVFLEKTITTLRLASRNRKSLNYQEAIKYAE